MSLLSRLTGPGSYFSLVALNLTIVMKLDKVFVSLCLLNIPTLILSELITELKGSVGSIS